MFRSGVFQRVLAAVGVVGLLTLAVYAQKARAQYPRNSRNSVGPGVAVAVRGSVQDAVDWIGKAVADQGMMVMGELHQGKVLAMTGLKLESETIFVGNPNVGKKVFSEEPGAGVALPIRINIYKDAKGQTIVRWIPPSHQLQAFGNAQVNETCNMLDEKLEKLVAALPQ
jgi:uncharacterized protein (DUF302 family)